MSDDFKQDRQSSYEIASLSKHSPEELADYVHENKQNFTPQAVVRVIDECIKDSDYLAYIQAIKSRDYHDTLKNFAYASFVWIDSFCSDNLRIRIDRPIKLMKHTGLRINDFDMVYRAFCTFVWKKKELRNKSVRECVKIFKRNIVDFIKDKGNKDDFDDLQLIRDFFSHWDKYKSSPSYRISC